MKKKLKAFTLAEVLITLAIVGVVAALTIPNLMSNYREKTTMNKLKKFYSTMSQAQLRAIVDYGDVETWDWVAAGEESNNQIVRSWFDKYFGQYIQNLEIVEKTKIDSNNQVSDKGVVVSLSDGTLFVMGGFSGSYLHFYYYTNPKTFYSNTARDGIDSFLFGFSADSSLSCSKRFSAYGICDMTLDVLKYNSLAGCYTENPPRGHAYCSAILMKNGWEVPDDYPYRF